MLNIPLTRKYKSKYLSTDKNSESIVIPELWEDFAPLTKIRSGAKIVDFVPYDYQIKLIEDIEKNSLITIAKTRQLGITETISNYFLHKALRHDGYLAVIFSKTQSDTSNIAKRLRRQIESLGVSTKTDSLTDIEFQRGGRILFRNSTAYGSRGLESVSDILFDECSFIDDIEEIYKSAIPTTSMNSDKAKIILLSTPNGQSGFYYDKLQLEDLKVLDTCKAICERKLPPYQCFTSKGKATIFIHWLSHPEYSQIDNYLEVIRDKYDLSSEIVEQEYNLSFSSSDSIVFPPDLIARICKGEKETIKNDRATYFIGIDCSGMGNDYTVATVIKQIDDEYFLVDWYRNRKKTSDYNILQIVDLIEKYTPQRVGIEINGLGQIYYEQLVKLTDCEIEKITTNQSNKIGNITRLILAMEQGVISIPRKSPYYQEFFDFRSYGEQYRAISGKNDDCIMSLAISLAVTPYRPLNKSTIVSLKNYIV
jgi:phage terminase large subunit-like protein